MLEHIYFNPKLENHHSVMRFENIKGVSRNMFFVDHDEAEVLVCFANVYTGHPIQQRWFKRRPVYILALYTRQPQHRDHPTLFRIVRGFFYVPQNYQHSRNCETGPPTYRPYPRRLESLTICRWYYKGSTFSSVILRL